MVNDSATPFGEHRAVHYGMADDRLIRVANLKQALRDVPKEKRAAYLAEKTKTGKSYWSSVLGDAKKPFGEKAARAAEEALGLPRGSLDVEGGSALAAPRAALGATSPHPAPAPAPTAAPVPALPPSAASLLHSLMVSFGQLKPDAQAWLVDEAARLASGLPAVPKLPQLLMDALQDCKSAEELEGACTAAGHAAWKWLGNKRADNQDRRSKAASPSAPAASKRRKAQSEDG